MPTLYFAYGSNLNRRGMARRCPRARAIGPAWLLGYRLVFRRFADLTPDAKGAVPGVLYELTPACLHALDRYEEVPMLYRRVTLTVTAGDKAVAALAYVTAGGALAAPELAYYTDIARGYREWDLDEAILRKARIATLQPGTPLPAAR